MAESRPHPEPKPLRTTDAAPVDPGRLIRWLAAAILVWGVFHAVGAWRLNHNPLRAVVVLACVAGFLGFWMLMLAARRRRLSRGR